jgi:hypothetical protein
VNRNAKRKLFKVTLEKNMLEFLGCMLVWNLKYGAYLKIVIVQKMWYLKNENIGWATNEI